MVNWLYQQQMERLWTAGGADEGVVLKKARQAYTCCPADMIEHPSGFFKNVEALNVRVAMTVNTRVIKLFLHRNDKPYVPLKNGLRLQVLPDISALPRCQKHHFAAFIADRGILVVWDDEPRHLLDRAQKIEKALMEMIWNDDPDEDSDYNPDSSSGKDTTSEEGDVEKGTLEKPRKIMMLMPIISACTLGLTTLALGSGFRSVAIETEIDASYVRLAFFLALPAVVWLSLFFFQALVGNVAQMIGPVNQVHQNTKFYSGLPPRRLRCDAGPLPHVTIQLPVYKEGLHAVIEPTVRSLKAAMSTYEMQGGTANIFVNDDGMQIVPEEDARARREFYEEHNMGWVARPKHNPKPKEGEELFLRRGKFKKASNMNYAMWVSMRVEDILRAIDRHDDWSQDEETAAYQQALATVVADDQGRTWADGDIRMGDYILIIDSDTRVPEDCFLDCVSEMEQSPQVAIIQYSSGVMNVTDSFFERGITFFTHLVYTQIRFAVATGDVAPFVGHNAVLRWAAVQEIAYECPDDHREKFWSECTVSEDFDMALRLQTAGYLVRLGGYTGDGFQEGVSLTVYDELARWEKYAYGCNELIFHPLKDWFRYGPFTKLFTNFLKSSMPLPSKITIMAYIGTYYAIGSAWILTIANYFLTGWLNGYLDHYYLDSFRVYFSIIIVFTAMGNVALAVLRYRTKEKTLLRALIENLTWIPLLTIFLGGISLHVSQALLSHMFSIDMSWGATSKEAENTTFFEEVPKIIRKFKFTFIFCFLCAIMMIVMARFAPPLWRIDYFFSIWPLSTIVVAHFFLPIALNPGLMRFTW
ncbi:glycosyl transferase family group 2-domain-containing protein [Neohortaea acidophila]|uniref:Glycosyl transferase family group 2-domain-containing protein n=1 Tax=Neohortaea acidophila TaxID=245834 RepID=A0A6A6PRW6_9PEZI|nr:glycosyl transferase family group 2-domain-containing protein [Neohortaea acidophila]KAF2482839.1 glycosyl transferase family group 2-domain-containing protein [Neohortaea acidophila]